MNDKQAKSKRRLTRRALLTLCLTLVVVLGAVGGSVAWLTDKTEEIVNTFTAGDINITLTETPNTNITDGDLKNDKWVGKMVPSGILSKDPKVTVAGGSEACFLFVKVTEEHNNLSGDPNKPIITYEIDEEVIDGDKWTQGTTENGVPEDVYFRKVNSPSSDKEFPILKGNLVTVSNFVTKANLDAMETSATLPKLSFTAYAVQQLGMNDNAATAWEAVSP